MHQLALAFKSMGVKVYGYDLNENKYTQLCKQNGIKVFHKFDKDLCNVDLCVKTAAVKNNKFTEYLKQIKCPIVDRAEVLGWLATKFKKVIAVAGTHGKSTTASLIYEILRVAGKKVSCHIGAEVYAPRFVLGDDYLVVEACEYNKSFLSLFPYFSVVTNIEREHMECYSSLFDLQSSFWIFLKRAQKRFVFLEKSTKFLSKYKNIDFVELSNKKFNTKLKGVYNAKNISLAYEVCRFIGVKEETILKVIKSFDGVARRYELIGKLNDQKVFIDYAHHPTEVKNFVDAFNLEFCNNQIIFQPHTFSRTKNFFKNFVSILSKIENLIIYKEYSAREKPVDGISAKDLYIEVKKFNPSTLYVDNFKNLVKNLKNDCSLAFVGAGDINLVAERLIKEQKT